MPSTTNAAAEVDKAGAKAAADKVHEKVAEKRRALGRGLDSLLSPQRSETGLTVEAGPRAVAAATAPSPTAAVPAAPAQTGQTGETAASLANETATIPPTLAHAASSIPIRMTAISALQAAQGGNAPSLGEAKATGAPSSFSGNEVMFLALDLIDDNPHQTRRIFHENALQELAESIRVQGVLQPIVVRADGEGRYKLILGERRIRASRLAEIETIPAIVKRVSEQQAAEMTLVENLQRQDLNCVEQGQAFAKLSQQFNLTQEQIGARVGMSREAVSNYMRLTSLPESVLEALIGGRLTFSHARVLLQLKTKDPVALWYNAKKAIDHGMSVKKFEDFVLGKFSPPDDDRPPSDPKHEIGGARWVDPNVKAAQRSLEEVLGMRVRIRDRAGRGKIVIEYATIDDFQRVVGMLKGQ